MYVVLEAHEHNDTWIGQKAIHRLIPLMLLGAWRFAHFGGFEFAAV